MKNKKHIHFIGIGGTAMASIAVAFRQAGFKITGSEPKEIFPPMSDYLKKNKIKYYFPFNPEKIGKPDEIIIGNAHYSDENPEVKYARKNKIKLEHFPKLLEKYLIKKNSVVIAGTYGKTTTTAMVSWLFERANKNPNYLLGGLPLNFNHGARLTKSNWSIVEGDEYPAASPWDYSPKFKYYHPKYLILTSAEWDHFDIFKTKKSYIDVFKKLVKSVPKDGLIVAKLGGENLDEVLKHARCKIIFYNCNKNIKYKNKKIYNVKNIFTKNKKTEFELYKSEKLIGGFQTQLIGDFNLENWCAAITLASELKLPFKKIQQAVKTFKGVKRRLEVRSVKNKITVIDDFAHSPSKAKASVKALVKHFPNSKIFVVFEPNRGGRALKCMPNYSNIFTGVYKVFIPKLTEYKKKPGVYDVSGSELTKYLTHLRQGYGGQACDFSRRKPKVIYQPDSNKILQNILKLAKPNDVVAFMGSRNFDGMIKELIKKL